MAQRYLCNSEGPALDTHQKRIERSRAIMGRFRQMDLPMRDQIIGSGSKGSKRGHIAKTILLDHFLCVHNGAEMPLVDNLNKCIDSENHPLNRAGAVYRHGCEV
jgi:hypothetical protein